MVEAKSIFLVASLLLTIVVLVIILVIVVKRRKRGLREDFTDADAVAQEVMALKTGPEVVHEGVFQEQEAVAQETLARATTEAVAPGGVVQETLARATTEAVVQETLARATTEAVAQETLARATTEAVAQETLARATTEAVAQVAVAQDAMVQDTVVQETLATAVAQETSQIVDSTKVDQVIASVYNQLLQRNPYAWELNYHKTDVDTHIYSNISERDVLDYVKQITTAAVTDVQSEVIFAYDAYMRREPTAKEKAELFDLLNGVKHSTDMLTSYFSIYHELTTLEQKIRERGERQQQELNILEERSKALNRPFRTISGKPILPVQQVSNPTRDPIYNTNNTSQQSTDSRVKKEPTAQDIVATFKSVLNRNPNERELTYYAAMLKSVNNLPMQQLRTLLQSSTEYKQQSQTQDNNVGSDMIYKLNEAVVQKMIITTFKNVYGRNPNESEAMFLWEKAVKLGMNEGALQEYVTRLHSIE